jgi:hypothetical protein
MTSTCVPGMFVRSQLSRIPGEERKFKRCRIMAFVPVCKRERELAASHALSISGDPITGVGVASIAGFAAGDGRGAGEGVFVLIAVGEASAVATSGSSIVEVGEDRGPVGTDSIVSVGEGGKLSVNSISGITVEERGVVVPDSLVPLADSMGGTVGVCRMDMDVLGISVEFERIVAGGFEAIISEGENTVDSGTRV